MLRSRRSIARLMAAIVLIALDCAALRLTAPVIYPAHCLMVVVLEVGLFRLVSRRGAIRPFWVGFEVVGWAWVIGGYRLYRPLDIWIANNDYIMGWFDVLHDWGDFLLPLALLALCVISGLPALVTALAGGLLTRGLLRRRAGAFRTTTPNPLSKEAPACVS
ncbi:MAG: hypothetical protein IRY99_03855 [Isosphaeraceae bacterium]|nr:hypothetical protein [Isosphaeraceae bacterium]